MKKINIVNIQQPVNGSVYISQLDYSVSLGNGKTKHFGSYKMAKQFVAETNRFLNEIMHQCNYLYIYSFGEFRRNWIYFSARKTNVYLKLDSIEKEISESLKTIDHLFNMVVTRSHYPNGNHFVWIHLNKLIHENLLIYKKIEELLKERNTSNKELFIYRNLAKNLLLQLNNYPDLDILNNNGQS